MHTIFGAGKLLFAPKRAPLRTGFRKMKITPYFLLGLLGYSALSFAHGGGHPTRFVSENGVDSGECGSPATACATINFAVQQSNKGDKIQVSKGSYEADELDVFYLLSNMIEIQGGYSQADGFAHQDINKNPTRIVGVPYTYRAQLAERGFTLLQDEKGSEVGLRKNEKIWLKTYTKLTAAPSPPAECVDGMAGSNPCHNIDRVAQIPLSSFSSNPSSANDIWGFVDLNNQREYALIGLRNGTAIVDLSDAENPEEVGHIPAGISTWRDIKVYQHFDEVDQRYKAYAYITTEAAQGLQIVDLTELPNEVTLAATRSGDFTRAHNVYLANTDYATGLALEGLTPFLYIAGANSAGGVFLTYDLSDPLAPQLVSRGNSGYVHDATTFVIDDARTENCASGHNPCEILVDFNENSVDIWDMTNKSAPFLISETSYPNLGYVHSGWWSEDKMTVFVQDETDERDRGLRTTLRAMDISDLTAPCVSNIYSGPTTATDHNGFTKGDYYYMSNYRRGLTVLDVSDVSNIRDVGFFDTFAVPEANIPSFQGAWGTYPYLHSGNILVSDVVYGLWILRLNENDGAVAAPGSTQAVSCNSRPSNPNPSPNPNPPSSSSGGGSVPPLLLLMLLTIAALQFCARRR